MNRLERMMDQISPELSVGLRVLKMRLGHDNGELLMRECSGRGRSLLARPLTLLRTGTS